MSTRNLSVHVFEYVEYRRFLDDYYKARKALDLKFSHRAISAHIGTGSAGWFSDIVKGRTNLTGRHIVSLVKLLKLNSTEAEYFDLLVRVDQAGSIEEKSVHYKKLLTLKGVKPELVGSDRFEYYSEWYHSAVRELLVFHDFRGDYAALGKKLHPAIGGTEAKRSVQLLEKLGFVQKQASGVYSAMPATLKKDPAFKALHLAGFLKAQAALGTESLERFPKEERDISSMTLALSPEAFLQAKEEVRALRLKLLALTENGSPDKVFQCNFHIFPVTR